MSKDILLSAALERLVLSRTNPDPPTDGEMWDPDRLEAHGRTLAQHSGLVPDGSRLDLKRRLRGNARALQSAYSAIVAALHAGRAISPAAQWIVDNFHVISDQLSEGPQRLTPRVWRRLPAAGHAGATGWPRVFHIATEYLRHTLWDFHPESLIRLLQGYQQVTALTMREVWALYPILRIALIDELRRVAVRVEDSIAARAAADELADLLAQQEPAAGEGVLPQAPLWPEGRFTPPFIVQLAYRLQGMGERGRPLLDALAHELHSGNTTIDDYIQRQHARRSASNVAARNIITSLRALNSFDWRTLFEKVSCVETLLRERPDYIASDRRTRDRYRSSIADIASATRREEPLVTRQILALLSRPGDTGQDLGCWLIGPRREDLERALECPLTPRQRLRRLVVRHARGLYTGGIAAFTLAGLATALLLGTDWRNASPAFLLLLAVLAAVPVSELAIGVLNRLWLHAFPPLHLPRLALEHGLRADMKTLVVVPTMLRSPAEAAAACQQLHVHALANPDPQICFALLSDWTDSRTETAPGDDAILEAARAGIEALNRAAPGSAQKYFLLHRRRVWVRTERVFTGWERKRGKLQELNWLLLGSRRTSFLPDRDGVLCAPEGIRYVLTVDADTRLPLGSVRDLVGTAAHPLNRPVIATSERRVVQGYGVLQPRITPLLPGAEERSLYREITTSAGGTDPYAAAASDLHQDLFGEGLFTGKGLYDVAAWEQAMAGRVPEEAVLSHDLFEGLFARCGLVTDIELFEDFPSHSEVAAARTHRWMRGDWQLLPWILGRRGPLPPMGRWKILDNLRRSLLAPFSMALLVTAFADSSSWPLLWLALVLSPAVVPALGMAIERLFRAPAARSRRMHLLQLGSDLWHELVRAAMALALLAQDAWLAFDAICRALFRLLVTRRHMLEWVTAAQVKAGRGDSLASFVWPLKSASIVVVGAVAVFMVANPPAITLFAPLLLLWWLSPVLARFLSRPLDRPAAEDDLPEDVATALRGSARLTWTFFERFVTAQDNHLPPDNFQEDPQPVVAHRSSPTNFGLYLLATVAARDFGWLGMADMRERLAATLATLERLERFAGHFLNWYDTRTLAVLSPPYVSTVDSGNLAGHLLTLRQACLQFRQQPLLSPRAFTGVRDALGHCRRAIQVAHSTDTEMTLRHRELLAVLRQLERQLDARPATLRQARDQLRGAQSELARLADDAADAMPSEVVRWLRVAAGDLASQLRDLEVDGMAVDLGLPVDTPIGRLAAQRDLSVALEDFAARCARLVDAMSFGFLYDRSRGQFSIGLRVVDRALDSSYYDLLASEARLASLVAIAKGDVPRSHWVRLGRRLTGGARRPVLASWSGSMFEYLMPALVMHEPRFSLLEQTCRRVVRQQIEYGEHHGLPWGISESAYNVRDRELTYQYCGFGLPTLGLKRGLGADYVVAPYASALAAVYRPVEASNNLHALAFYGARGEFGYYEALDFTATRVPEGRSFAVVRAYMAHHQGMTLVALDNVLQQRIMQARFHAEPLIMAADLLLQERRIRFAEAPALIEADVPQAREPDEMPDVSRTVEGHAAPVPVTHLLSNRGYTVMLTDSGGGYSATRSSAVTRWREDATRDCWGSFIYLYDVEQRRLWSGGFQPTAAVPDDYRVHFNEESVVFARRDGALRTTTTIVVTPEESGELRQVTLHNDGTRPRHVEITSYAEIVLAPQRADIAHPGFSNLFVQTQYAADSGALLATRRPRSDREAPVWAIHVLAGMGAPQIQYETDRSRFIGRGRDTRRPLALDEGQALSGTVGNVLDPIFSLRTRVTVPPRGSVTTTFGTFIATSREQALALIARYRTPALFEHVLGSAWTFARAELHHLQSSLGEAMLFQTLAGGLLLANRQLRAQRESSNTLDVQHLWRFSISGDRPILLIRCRSQDDLPFIQQCLRAQDYLRIKNLLVDVVILNERRHSYVQDLQWAIERLVRAFASHPEGDDRGGIHALAIDNLDDAERQLLFSLARVVLDPAQGSLLELLSRPSAIRSPPLPVQPAEPQAPRAVSTQEWQGRLEFFNGWGGFDGAAQEYVIALSGNSSTPAPWSNVLANEEFGSLVTERGSTCTWSQNSRENQLTAWSNDAVCDPSGEAFYLVPESGAPWSPCAQPIRRQDAQYVTRHGQGYSRFEVACQGVETALLVCVAAEDPVKLCRLQITNRRAERLRLTVVAYVEWTLGAARAGVNHDIQTRIDKVTGAQFAGNPALPDFGARVAICDLGGRQQHSTNSRHQFLGRNGSPALPAGLAQIPEWSAGRPGQDACCAFAVVVDIAPGATEEVRFVIGQAADEALARQLVQRYRALDPEDVLEQVRTRWNRLLGAVQIRTPDRALDLLFNRWLLYQTTACRLWGRAGFYQAGGAYGFRDQLQDGMALVLPAPREVRAHLLRAAARQFVEGDVQHWWHPPSGRGVRTHFSDDRLWLPYAVHQYLEATHDLAVLDEVVPFIEGPPLPLEREDAHYVPDISGTSGSLYEHCARALDRSLGTGVHQMPLMGGGDWNDGMNRVGHEGRGESVWLGWFLIDTLRRFVPIAQARNDMQRGARWRAHAEKLVHAAEREAWDGQWYRRAWFDDGTPLGSRSNTECRIDSLSQSWAVISKAAEPERARQAMDAVMRHLLREDEGLVLLFAPPFDAAPVDPGYIKGYLPGLRENGGQYTHAAVWVLVAQAMLCNEHCVGELLRVLNPVHRSASPQGARTYRVEPYVLAADIYTGGDISQRGGWTWYTGAAGWLYRAVLEHVLGVRVRGDELQLRPCVPADWTDFEVALDLPGVDYQLRMMRRPVEQQQLLLDGAAVAGDTIPLLADGQPHSVLILLPQTLHRAESGAIEAQA